MIQLLSRAAHITADDLVGVGVIPRIPHPGSPVGIILCPRSLNPHEMFFYVDFFRQKISDISPLPIRHGADWVTRALRDVVVQAVGILPMTCLLSPENSSKAPAIVGLLVAVTSSKRQESWQNIRILHHGISSSPPLDFLRPPCNQARMYPCVPIRPFTPGKL